MPTNDPRRDRIKDQVARYNERVRAIREDTTLSAHGKRQQLQALYDQARATVGELRGTLDDLDRINAENIQKRLFGTAGKGADAISHRDALDRVARCRRPEELGELMEAAHTSGDTVLLRAAAQHAWQRSRDPLASDHWGELVGEYARQNGLEQEITALTEMTSSRNRTAQFAEQMEMTVRQPDELRQPERGGDPDADTLTPEARRTADAHAKFAS